MSIAVLFIRFIYLHLKRHAALADHRSEEHVHRCGHGQTEFIEDGGCLLFHLWLDSDGGCGYVRRHGGSYLSCIPRCHHFNGLRRPRDPVVHIGRQDVEHVADAGRAGAVGELKSDRGLRRAGIGRHEGAAPAEPVEVGSEVLGGHALEACHERIEERMDGVDAVDSALRTILGIIRLMRGDLQVMQHVDICGSLVRGDYRACADTAAKGLRRALARDHPSPRDLEEGGVRVADARHYANLLAGEAALVNLLAAMACLSRQGEGPLGMVALKGLGEVRLIEFAGLSLPDVELGRILLQALDEPVAHGVRGLEADAAAIGALAEREHEDEALGIGHPGLARQLARAEDPVGGAGERPSAVAAEVALLTVSGLALLDDSDRAAAGATLYLVAAARRIVEYGGTDDIAHRLDCTTALGLAEFCHIFLEGDDQILGIHVCSNVVVVDLIIPRWHHLYVNSGLTEPKKFPNGKLAHRLAVIATMVRYRDLSAVKGFIKRLGE